MTTLTIAQTAERLFSLLPAGKEPIAEALVGIKELSFSQKQFLWKLLKKYEFSLKMIGVAVPPEPLAPDELPTEPYYVHFVNGRFLLKLSESQAEHIHMVPKAKYDKKTNLYTVPNRMYPVLQLHKFIKQVDVFCSEAGKAAVLWMYNEMRERYHASKAHDAEIDMGDFGLALDPYQKAGIKAAARCKRAFIADSMGLGKTRQGLGVVWVLDTFPTVVICPPSVLINWKREAIQGLIGKSVYLVQSTKMPRHSCQDKQLTLFAMQGWDRECKACQILHSDVVIINYDKLATGWKQGFEVDEKTGKKRKIKGWKRGKGERADVELSEVGSALQARGFKACIIDESHYIKSDTSQRTKAVQLIVARSEARLALSGTPIKNRPKELVPQLKVLDRLDDLGGYDVFVREFCAAEMRDGKFDDTGSSNETELNKYLRSIGFIQRNKRDVRSELPPVRYATIWVDIDNREEYERVEKDVVNWCAEQAVLKQEFLKMIDGMSPDMADYFKERRMIETRLKIMRVQALVRVGALKRVAALGKLNAAKSWIEDFLETEKKLVTFANLRDVQYAITDYFNCLHIHGKDKVQHRQHHVDVFMGAVPNDTGCSDQQICCSFGAAREGVNLDAADDILLLERMWTPTDEDQAIARVDRHRAHNITAWTLMATDTIEESIAQKLEAKREIVDAVTKGTRGAASTQELSVFDEVFAELAAMSTHAPSGKDAREQAESILADVRLGKVDSREMGDSEADSEFLEEAVPA